MGGLSPVVDKHPPLVEIFSVDAGKCKYFRRKIKGFRLVVQYKKKLPLRVADEDVSRL